MSDCWIHHAGSCINLHVFYEIGKPDGTLGAQISNPAVPQTVLSEILSWRSEGATDMDVITRLRQRTVPSGYDIHSWIQGTRNIHKKPCT